MALLREQRNLIRELHNLHSNEDTDYARKSQMSKLGVMLGSAEEINVIAFLKTRPLLFSDKGKDVNAIVKDSTEYNDRSYKIGNLYKSCKDAKFIEPHIIEVPKTGHLGQTETANVGVAITDRGSDLLNFLGFWSICLEKYSKPLTVFWTFIGTVLVGSIGWLFLHFAELKTIFLST